MVRHAHAGGAVLFDRDGTLIIDVPYNGDPDLVVPAPHAAEALDLVRRAGVPFAVITNQSGVARGMITEHDVRRVNDRVEELLGPIPVWAVCIHGPGAGCSCRKPQPGLVLDAAATLGVAPGACIVIGDSESDRLAAENAGCKAILIRDEGSGTEFGYEIAGNLLDAVRLALSTINASRLRH